MFSVFGNKKPPPPAASQPSASSSWLSRLRAGLARTGERFKSGLRGVWSREHIDDALFDELEALLIGADVGPRGAARIILALRAAVREHEISSAVELADELKAIMTRLLAPLERPLDVAQTSPFVIMIVGVNGAGKTTSIGKLAHHFQQQGKTVMLAAGDTFRAAAREQLATWGERNGITVITQEGGDAAAVIFDAVQAARARGIDVVLADTAGRLPTQLHLMEELKKVKRVIAKACPEAPHEVLLVLDANTGQNAMAQVRAFNDALGITGIALTKLDGTAKGGAILALAETDPAIPVRFIGVGEQMDDLRPFIAAEFVGALLE